MSDSSPDGVSGNKSSKTWAMEAKASASHSASSASASATSANNSSASATAAAKSAADAKAYTEAPRGQTPSGGNSARVWAEFTLEKAQAATASASAASTSATNAKASETNAANSAKAAKASADRAATFDPTSYYTKTETYTKKEVQNQVADFWSTTDEWEKAKANNVDTGYFMLVDYSTIEPKKVTLDLISTMLGLSRLVTKDEYAKLVLSNGHLSINGSELWIE